MEIDTARFIHLAIMAVAVLAWLAGLWSIQRTFGSEASNTFRGQKTYPVPPSRVRQWLTRMLATGSQGVTARIRSASDREVVADLTLLETLMRKGRASSRQRVGAVLSCDLDSCTEGTELAYRLEVGALVQGSRVGALVMSALGAAALVAASVLMWCLIIPSPEPAVRGQVWQSFQVVHFLWPTFLFTYNARRVREVARGMVEDLLSNMAFVMQDGDPPLSH